VHLLNILQIGIWKILRTTGRAYEERVMGIAGGVLLWLVQTVEVPK